MVLPWQSSKMFTQLNLFFKVPKCEISYIWREREVGGQAFIHGVWHKFLLHWQLLENKVFFPKVGHRKSNLPLLFCPGAADHKFSELL